MVIAVHAEIEQFDSLDGENGVGDRADLFPISALAEIGNAFHYFHKASNLVDNHFRQPMHVSV
jgi:hypothetical protein